MNDLLALLDEHRAWLLPLGMVAAGLLVGLIVERVIFVRLRQAVRDSDRAWDDFLVDALGHVPVFLVGALGAWLALGVAEIPAQIAEWMRKAIEVLVILAFTLVAARLAGGAVRRWAERSGGMIAASSLIANLAKAAVFVLGLIMVLQALDVAITPWITGLGIGGLAVALALQPTLANLFSGIQILAARQVGKGDYVRLDTGDEGYVVDIKWRNTTIQGLYDDHEIVVPNSKLADAILTNYNLPRKAIWLRCEVGVHYSSDLEQVEKVTLEVAREVVDELCGGTPATELEPVVRFHTFGDSSIGATVRIPVDEFAAQFRVRHEFVKRLQRRFREEGIVIPFPIRTLEWPRPLRVETEEADPAGPAES